MVADIGALGALVASVEARLSLFEQAVHLRQTEFEAVSASQEECLATFERLVAQRAEEVREQAGQHIAQAEARQEARTGAVIRAA